MKRLFLGIYLGVVVTVPAYAQLKASSERTLTINETLASDKLQRVGNSVMVPLADVAKALGLSIVKTKTGYALLKGGGANQVEGLRGKLGETLFDGKWRFTVQSVRNETSYSVETKTTTRPAMSEGIIGTKTSLTSSFSAVAARAVGPPHGRMFMVPLARPATQVRTTGLILRRR